jgi:bifunctional DNA-binding transcriptional regulator/antitoxin component of YhaV-PrlF toxin-antitoxin module
MLRKAVLFMERERICISAKRQITIPQKFYDMLGFDNEAECIVHGNELIIRPVKETAGGEFAEQILADLIAQGFQGEELLARFKEAQRKVRPAVEAMLRDAERAADREGDYSL